MADAALEQTINDAWENRMAINTSTTGAVRQAVEAALALLDSGKARVAERQSSGEWAVNQWLKKAVLLSFRLNDNELMNGPAGSNYWDKVPLKFEGWGENRFRETGFRAVPGAFIRSTSYIAKNVILMPSFVNVGAYVDEGTMVD